jgi:hypothetical protein
VFEVSEWVLASLGCSEVVEYIGVEDLSTNATKLAICKFPGNRALNISTAGRKLSLFRGQRTMHLQLQSVHYEYSQLLLRHSEDGSETLFVEYSEWYVVY